MSTQIGMRMYFVISGLVFVICDGLRMSEIKGLLENTQDIIYIFVVVCLIR